MYIVYVFMRILPFTFSTCFKRYPKISRKIHGRIWCIKFNVAKCLLSCLTGKYQHAGLQGREWLHFLVSFGSLLQEFMLLVYSLYSLFSGLTVFVSFPWLWSVTRVKYTPFLSSNWLCVPLSTARPCSKPTITSALLIVDRRCEMLIVVLPCRA